MKKNLEKLTSINSLTNNPNNWFWRDGELSLKEFTQLNKEEKFNHIKFLMEIPEDELSTNDEYILYNNGFYSQINQMEFEPLFNKVVKNFITLDEEI